MLLGYGYLVPNGCNYEKHCACSWNMVIWSQLGASIKITIDAPRIWLHGPKWVQLSKPLLAFFPESARKCTERSNVSIWPLLTFSTPFLAKLFFVMAYTKVTQIFHNFGFLLPAEGWERVYKRVCYVCVLCVLCYQKR